MVLRGEYDRRCDQASLGPRGLCGVSPQQPHASAMFGSPVVLRATETTIHAGQCHHVEKKGGLSMQAGLQVCVV